MNVLAPFVFAGFLFFVSVLLFLRIESTGQAILATVLAFIGLVTIWLSYFYKSDPLRKKKIGLEDDYEYFTDAAKRAKKKRDEIDQQEEMESLAGQVFPTEDGKGMKWVEKIDGEWVWITEPLRFFQRIIYGGKK